jgi:2-phospho-L-lactate guanylyltransferase
MKFWAIVPIKPLQVGKSRLSGFLNDSERYLTCTTLFANTLMCLAETMSIDQIAVVSRDLEAEHIGKLFGASHVVDETVSSLNFAVELGIRQAIINRVDGVVILPADIPLLSTGQLETAIDLCKTRKGMVIIPDRREDGTNALVLSPPDAIQLNFGPGSFKIHVNEALNRQINCVILRDPGMSLDLDTQDDLEWLKANVDLSAPRKET